MQLLWTLSVLEYVVNVQLLIEQDASGMRSSKARSDLKSTWLVRIHHTHPLQNHLSIATHWFTLSITTLSPVSYHENSIHCDKNHSPYNSFLYMLCNSALYYAVCIENTSMLGWLVSMISLCDVWTGGRKLKSSIKILSGDICFVFRRAVTRQLKMYFVKDSLSTNQ